MNRFSPSALLFVAILSCGGVAAHAQDKLGSFMQGKLSHSREILRGLAVEDFSAIAKHSQAMSLLSEDELWTVLQTPEYRARSAEFKRSVDAITESARTKNLDAAALNFVDATMKCVSCHKYVRNVRPGSSTKPAASGSDSK